MYCPQCATPNAGEVKFCRSCGAELEAVALALSGKAPKPGKAGGKKNEPKTAEDWVEKRIEAVSGMARGAMLLSISALLGAAMSFFIPATFDAPWILVWVVFFGWMAVWGGIEMAYGIGGTLESKSRLRLLQLTGKQSTVDTHPQQLLTSGERPAIANLSHGFKSPSPVSVTEGTTRQLDDPVEQ